MHGRGRSACPNPPEKKRRRDAQQAQEGQQAKIINVSQQRSLPNERVINRGVRLLWRRHRIAVRRERGCQLAQPLLKGRVVRCQMRDHRCLVYLCSAREHSSDGSNAKATANVSHQIEYAGGIADLLVG